ncbi:hypothetical protein BN10_950006 [Phycicoccus elongatus Lp2]|uniref:Uncharacterized protein n=1 Tax=Phycicoccus elongatus Lp2 TaxID=1193181 RepID=N0E5S9_9MICO|nr:hypothetical protein BN10_950006 [Phycicoccus elongatus Lp2]
MCHRERQQTHGISEITRLSFRNDTNVFIQMRPESHRCQNTESRFGHEMAVSRVTGVTSCRPPGNEKVPDRDTWTMSRPGTAEPPVGIEPTTYSLRVNRSGRLS